MTALLVSFCNTFPPDVALGLYSFDREEFRWVDLSVVGEPITGVTGLHFHEGSHWALAQLSTSGSSALVKLRSSCEVSQIFYLKEAFDAHSLVPFKDGFLVNDTRRNRLTFVQVSVGEGCVQEVEHWRYCDEHHDIVHVNSLAEFDGDVYVSMFGAKPEGGWRHARDGAILNTSTNSVIVGDLFHPHSLQAIDGYLYWLESGTGLVHRFSSRGHEVILHLDGYLRGITFDREHMYIGASAARRRSKSIGTLNQQVTSNPALLNSWIYRVDRETLQVEKRRLTAFGAEIYDLAIVRGDAVRVLTDDVDPVLQRIWKCEDAYINQRGELERQWSALQRERAEADGVLERQLREREALVAQVQALQQQLRVVHQECAAQTARADCFHYELARVQEDLWSLQRTHTVRASRFIGNVARQLIRQITRLLMRRRHARTEAI